MKKKKNNTFSDIIRDKDGNIEYMFDGPTPIPPDMELSDEDIKRIREEHKKLGIDD